MTKPYDITPPGLTNKLLRLTWSIAWTILFLPSPIVLHGWRRFLLRCFGAAVGPKARPYPSARIWAPWNLRMDEGSCIGPHADIYNVAPIHLGRWSVVSQKAYLCAASHDVRGPGFRLIGAPIHVEDHAWVAAAAFVGPGVTVGSAAVAGACAVVTRDVPARAIITGNPARIVGETGEDFAGCRPALAPQHLATYT